MLTVRLSNNGCLSISVLCIDSILQHKNTPISLSSPLLILMTLSILVPDHEIQKPLLAVNVIYFEEITGWHPLIRIYLPSSNTSTFLDSCLELSLDQLTFPFPLCWISEANTAGLNIDVLFFVVICVYVHVCTFL